jgi:thioesterase domain-containing protein/acyl carrier protein
METQQTYAGPSAAAVASPSSADPGAVHDEFSRQLIGIWQQVLGIDAIGPDQNYFDLGGDSSLAVQIFAQIENVFKIKLPLATLYEAPTVGELATILRGKVSADRWSPLVCIQPSGSRPPFFCIHPHGGNVLTYRELSRQLGSDQPFYGLQSRGLNGGEEPLTRIEDMAFLYVSEMRRAQPHGPYFLGGYCMGGAVAYEMAAQLQEAGEEVALLALFDAIEFSEFPRPSWFELGLYNTQRALFHIANLLKLSAVDRSKFVSEKMSGLRVRVSVWLAGVRGKFKKDFASSADLSEAQILSRIWKANLEANHKYVARPYAGTVIDIRPQTQYRIFNRPQVKWDRRARSQKIIVLPVNPPAMMSDPFVKHLAQALRQCLDETNTSSRATDGQVSNFHPLALDAR